MQPLISPVDHESRSSTHREEESEIQPSEDTPLINRFPDNHLRQRNVITIITVGFLLTVLLAGVIIGIYLLILQSNSENILPPIDDTMKVLSIPQWSSESLTLQELVEAVSVVVTQTDTRQCDDTVECLQLIKEIQFSSGNNTLPYNFLLSSSGLTFEGLGWKRSPLYPDTLVVAFIGNFTDTVAPQSQIDAFTNLLKNSVSRHSLSATYTIIGRSRKYTASKLFERLSLLPEWNKQQSNTE